jgi:hypothetical protein
MKNKRRTRTHSMKAHLADRRAWRCPALAVLAVAALATAGCLGQRIFDEGPNHPPNTVFLDGNGMSTPAPDTTIRDSTATLVWIGTDVNDGDAIAGYFYRVSPPDTGWGRTAQRYLTLTNLRDTTYTVCVYAEDVRGGIEPEPTCRSFSVDVFRLGAISLTAEIDERSGNLVFYWEIVGSEEPWTAFRFTKAELVEYDVHDTQRYHPLADAMLSPVPQVVNGFAAAYGFAPDPSRRYCMTVWAEDTQRRQLAPRQLCYP